LKTPSVDLIEILSRSGLDFICLDAEHAPFDRARMDACLAVGRALDFPLLVRVTTGSEENLLMALDAGAVGVVVPHMDSVEKAKAIVKGSRYGRGGRGYAGSTRFAGFAGRTMPEILAQSINETIVIGQIEEPEGVEAIEDICAVEGLDGVFIGPADLSVCYGKTDINSQELKDAMNRVGKAAKAGGKTYITWVPNAEKAHEWMEFGFTTFVIGSEHSWMAQGAAAAVKGLKS
jgi:2-keto-3-deoxy-L-rhamnonate aldolase RhmA